MNLTIKIIQDYSFLATEKNVVRGRSLNDRGEEPQTFCNAAFLLSGVALYGRAGQGAARLAGAIPVFEPVQLRPPRFEACEAVLKTNWRSHTMTVLTILTTKIRQIDGLYSLNDLHKASGGEEKHAPTNFIRLDQTQALITEIQSAEMQTAFKVINGGAKRGTYVCRELVIAYAAWISAAFHLKVIQVFLSQSEQKSLPSQPAESPKRYDYPRKRLEQPYFTGKNPASLSMNMLRDKQFTSQVKALLNELRTDGHNVDAAWDEYIAMMEALIDASKFLDKTIEMAVKAGITAASTSLRE